MLVQGSAPGRPAGRVRLHFTSLEAPDFPWGIYLIDF